MRFRAWYSQGRVYDGHSEADFCSLPAEGAVTIVQFVSTGSGTRRLKGNDWFYLADDGLLYGSGGNPVVGQWSPKPQVADDRVKQGQLVSNEEYKRITVESREAQI